MLTAFASRRAVPSTHATEFLRTRWASHSRTSSFLSPCVCALACPRVRLRCLLDVLCVENALTPGMRTLALPCVGVRSPPAMTAACNCWFASHAPTAFWHASSPRTWARASPTVSSSSLDDRRPDRSTLSCPVPSPCLALGKAIVRRGRAKHRKYDADAKARPSWLTRSPLPMTISSSLWKRSRKLP